MGADRIVECEVVRECCERIGIKFEVEVENQGLRKEVLYRLSAGVDTLVRLTTHGHISLYDLAVNNLLPPRFSQRVRVFAPSDSTKCSERSKVFYKDIGALTDRDCEGLSSFHLIGKNSVDAALFLRDLHRQTRGFELLLMKSLTAAEKISLIRRIVDSVCNDPIAQRKLYATYPRPAP